MYFVKQGSDIYHILTDTNMGSAPCGQVMSNLDLWKLKQGELTNSITEEKPADKSLCKHCEKMLDK